MALKKAKVLPTGVSGEYWKITSATINSDLNRVTYKISLFLDKAHADGGAKSLGIKKSFSFDLDPEELDENLVASGYAKIKNKSMEENPFLLAHGISQPLDSDLADAEEVA